MTKTAAKKLARQIAIDAIEMATVAPDERVEALVDDDLAPADTELDDDARQMIIEELDRLADRLRPRVRA